MRINVKELEKAGFDVYHSTNSDGSLDIVDISPKVWDNKAVDTLAEESGLSDLQKEDIAIRVHQFQIWNVIAIK